MSAKIRFDSITPKRNPELALLVQKELLEIHIDEARRAFTERRGRRRDIKVRRQESVLREAARHKGRERRAPRGDYGTSAEAYSRTTVALSRGRSARLEAAFAKLPKRHRALLILSTFMLAFSIAMSANVLHARAMAAKRTLYVAADGRGDSTLIQQLSVRLPAP